MRTPIKKMQVKQSVYNGLLLNEKASIFEHIMMNMIDGRFDCDADTPAETRIGVKRPHQLSTTQFNIRHIESFSKERKKEMNELRIWANLRKRLSPDEITAHLLLCKLAKTPVPVFANFNSWYLKQFLQTIDNAFITPQIREEFVRIYCKLKQTYSAFLKLARVWKIRKLPIRIQTDLYMNELTVDHPSTFQLVSAGGIYLFSLSNLSRIIVDAITHQSEMFVEPLPTKNPYTNELLSKSDLFNVYLCLRERHFKIHEMMEKFYQCEFNVFEFRRKHETELRDFAIKRHAATGGVSELSQDVSDMLIAHRMTKQINISARFPKKDLVETMRPFLYLYLLERYSFSSVTRNYSSKKLSVALKKFAENNPMYGRRISSASFGSRIIQPPRTVFVGGGPLAMVQPSASVQPLASGQPSASGQP